MRKPSMWLVSMLLLLVGATSTPIQAQQPGSNGIAFRYIAPNHVWALSDLDRFESEDFGLGLEVEYYKHLNRLLDLSVPVYLVSTRLPNSDTNFNNIERAGSIGASALLNINLLRGRAFNPLVFGGVGFDWDVQDGLHGEFPVGVGLNIGLGNNTYLSTSAAYRINTGDFRNNVRLGAGLRINFGDPGPNPNDRDGDGIKNERDACPDTPGPESLQGCPDRDGDGVIDKDDACPDTPGIINMRGCPDQDGDGVADAQDKCPTVAGLAEMMGCPDRDGDKVTDAEDDCPDEVGPASNRGCPILDRDGDGVNDDVDSCPDTPGQASANGCPDRDGDGVADKDDKCPDAAGPAADAGCPDRDGDGFADNVDRCPDRAGTVNGCPEIQEQTRKDLERLVRSVQFETNKATLRTVSFQTLDQIVEVLKEYGGYSVRIEGHTDSDGSDAFNQDLSERRAKTCYDYLIDKGIAASRLSYEGFGESRPIATNSTSAGKAQNRRVMFVLDDK